MLLVIMRGLSGSGKSTRAKKIKREALKGVRDSAIICSADNYFMEHGKYVFNPRKLGEAHAWCKGQASAAMYLGADVVVIDNTNTQACEYKSYIELAALYQYVVEVEVVGETNSKAQELYAKRNVHGVPIDVIRKQAKRFENE